MSLVGPRPERPEFVFQLERHLPDFRDRMLILPGLTGLAQVHLPPDSDIASVTRKLAFDLYYLQHSSFWLDLRLVTCTAFHALGMPFCVTVPLCGVPERQQIEGGQPQRFAAD